MKISVDFSIMTTSDAFCRVYGELDIAIVPVIGDTIAFVGLEDREVTEIRLSDLRISFEQLRVVERILPTQGGMDSVSISLADIIVPNKEDARQIATFFEKSCDLFCDIYETDNSGDIPDGLYPVGETR